MPTSRWTKPRGALDTSIVAIALPTIGKALGDLEMLPWVAASHTSWHR